ncbi:MAG: DUF3368 domain-containing protein [Candidatus Thorarchaeota archaeon]|nr:DUF3368 domain-containing protein [Candidatus Thorarchaeota archaeon]
MPSKNRTVSNASPLIHLTRAGRIELLKDLFSNLLIPQTVHMEVCRTKETPDSIKIQTAIDAGWIRVVDMDNTLAKRIGKNTGIHRGEATAIVLAKKESALLLIDDKVGRTIAEMFGIKCLGTVGVLLQAVSSQLMDKNDMIHTLDRMIDKGFRLEARVYRRVLQMVKEL